MNDFAQQVQRAVAEALAGGRKLSTWARRAVCRAAQDGRPNVDGAYLPPAWVT